MFLVAVVDILRRFLLFTPLFGLTVRLLVAESIAGIAFYGRQRVEWEHQVDRSRTGRCWQTGKYRAREKTGPLVPSKLRLGRGSIRLDAHRFMSAVSRSLFGGLGRGKQLFQRGVSKHMDPFSNRSAVHERECIPRTVEGDTPALSRVSYRWHSSIFVPLKFSNPFLKTC